MEYNQTASEPSWKQLMRLMESKLLDIIRKEHKNETRICLYWVGGYWTAFEKSAYMLRQIFPKCEILVINHPSYPFSVVVASVPDDELHNYGKTHIFCRNYLNYKELVYIKIYTTKYYSWHRRVTNKFSETINLLRQESV
ncbi:hypothetical protein [Bacteroides sp.]|uniref:hypothetical protein n=1 Tax=Bacteroides sp. TaxID=29523 RepID=UPI00261E1245|nr:hypothetical protein [Bacteroides sp.]MDD3038775.1 hypothetical protein [Bacteroides sp.]